MDESKKAEHISYCVKQLFHTRGKDNLSKDLMKTWIQGLMPFEIKDISDAFFKKMYDSDPFPSMGHIVDLVTNNTSNDALFIWQDFEDYCQSISQYRHSRDDADLDIAHKWKKILGDDMDNIILICDSNQYLEADKTQKNIWKNQFLKSFKNDTKKIENYLLKNDSKLLEEK